ncbi:MAG: cell division protein ZapA [Parvibaculum sp.]|jgi:cell division protein ZapA|uniref:cell division protein ZapA n=1 Tax=Parvibaculum sp. TaxID=2024848 RepID=UPI00284094C2|nr:cell division protein ZapA [Parvibaculum sp.]MDR3500006.1 cell division protein ZapA [Parvibaculum sp.]
MGQVTVLINDRAYTVACGDGEEDHLKDLAAHINRHVSELSRDVGQVGETRLLLMASLMVADELAEAQQKVHILEADIEQLTQTRIAALERSREAEDLLADVLDNAARRIEDIARRVDAA